MSGARESEGWSQVFWFQEVGDGSADTEKTGGSVGLGGTIIPYWMHSMWGLLGHKWGPVTDAVGYEFEAQMSGLSQRWKFWNHWFRGGV